MFVVGNNLRELVRNYKIIDDIRDVEETCIELKLYKVVKRLRVTSNVTSLKYGETIPKEVIEKETIKEDGLCMEPGDAVLACSNQKVYLPQGYMGMVQTKGSLARMFVFAQCSDSQIDSGFSGRITFELFNASPFNIVISKGQKIANLYIITASDKNMKLYCGKYNNATEPTVPKP